MGVRKNGDLPTYFKPWTQIKKSHLPTYSEREARPESSRLISSNIDPISTRSVDDLRFLYAGAERRLPIEMRCLRV